MKYSLFTGFSLLILAIPCVIAQQHSVRPGINSYYMDPQWDHWVRQFESPGREVFDLRQEIIDAAGVKSGMDVADIGAGTGLHARLMARQVGISGKVYAVDISRTFIDNIKREAELKGLNNLVGVVNTARDAMLPERSIDLAITIDTYHHFEYPQDMLASIRQALRPGGRLVIIDFRKHPAASNWVKGHVRADRQSVIREVEVAGFELLSDKPLLRTNYFLEFARLDD